MVQALETSNAIWKEFRDVSMEAYKANELLTVMLGKLKHKCPTRTTTGTGQLPPFTFANTGLPSDPPTTFPRDDIRPEHSAAMTLGLLSSGGVASSSVPMFDRGFSPTPSGNVAMSDASSGLTPGYAPEAAVGDPTASLFTMLGQQGNLLDMPANFEWVGRCSLENTMSG